MAMTGQTLTILTFPSSQKVSESRKIQDPENLSGVNYKTRLDQHDLFIFVHLFKLVES